jgi:hypothetical protein
MMSEAEYALISYVCLYRSLDSTCHELEYVTPKFDGVCFFYISPKLVIIGMFGIWIALNYLLF